MVLATLKTYVNITFLATEDVQQVRFILNLTRFRPAAALLLSWPVTWQAEALPRDIHTSRREILLTAVCTNTFLETCVLGGEASRICKRPFLVYLRAQIPMTREPPHDFSTPRVGPANGTAGLQWRK